MMAAIVKTIKAALSFGKYTADQFLSRCRAVHNGFKDNMSYPTPPVDLPTFLTQIDNFAGIVAEALDGGAKAIAERNRQRGLLTKTMERLAHYAQTACNDDLATFLTSGFTPISTIRLAQTVAVPLIEKIEQGSKGQLWITTGGVRPALINELRYAAVENGVPGPWQTVTTSKSRTAVNGLIPSVSYTFQVRAIGRKNITDWSEFANRICI